VTSWSCRHGAAEMNPTRNNKVSGSISGLAYWVKDLALLWLWRRLAATAPIGPLAWECPYPMGAALIGQKDQKKKKKKKHTRRNWCHQWELMFSSL